MKWDIELTERDIQILCFLKEQGVATSDQLVEGHFRSSDAFRRRISHLIRFGLVEAVYLSQGMSLMPSRMLELRRSLKDRGRDWQKTKIYRLSKEIAGQAKRLESPLGEPIFWQHQLGLTEIRRHLLEQNIIDISSSLFLSDPEIKAEWARFQFESDLPIPDLVWRFPDREYAIEYERTTKGEMSYFQRMARYQRSHYQAVLFVANTDDIYGLLKRCALRMPKIGVTSRSSLRKVFTGISGIDSLGSFFNGRTTHERSKS